MTLVKSKQRAADHGEVFTPTWMVGRKEIQSFAGALADQQAHEVFFITTNDFADTAIAYAKKVTQKVILIDGDCLADLMFNITSGSPPLTYTS